jgi:uncharacterized protein (DUF362 family)
MNKSKEVMVHTAIGDGMIDRNGSAVAVARMDVDRSYGGIGLLLQKVIRDSNTSAWEEIKTKINYTYKNLDEALSALEKETPFLSQIHERLRKGQKLLFKPNLVSVESYEPYTFGPSPGSTGVTDWAFVAAVMRWFHDQAGISYYQMSIGEAATAMSSFAAGYRHLKKTGRPVTTEAVIEGRSDDFYGGWGFYFIRKYLSEVSDSSKKDDPMQGLEESMAGIYLPPGKVRDKLMVYDLNRICDDMSKGRDILVPDHENFESIILHKVIVGGDPSDPNDRALYPGCILINLPKLKIHAQALFTNAIKNLGIGLYPMEVSRSNDCQWEYSTPPNTKVPGMKGAIPHQVWIPELDPKTCIPLKNPDGTYRVKKTGGLTGTMLDIVQAVAKQDIFMVHIVDALEAINREHSGVGLGVREREGLAVAGLDPVATDQLCARYLFSNCGLKESEEAGLDDGSGGHFPQAVPVPLLQDKVIITTKGYDCPLSRDFCLQRAEKRGLGRRQYYVIGHDALTDQSLASFRGRLGYLDDNNFKEIVTTAFYTDTFKLPWDMQKTFFAYLDAVDQLQGASLKKNFLDTFDEDDNGIVTYEEYGKKGLYGTQMFLGGLSQSLKAEENEAETFRASYAVLSTSLRCSNPEWNPEGHQITREQIYGSVCGVAQLMSFSPGEQEDPYVPGLMWGKGKWPSYSLAYDRYLKQMIFGYRYPARVGIACLYGTVCAYADHRQNDRKFIGKVPGIPNTKGPQMYVEAVREGRMKPLDFTFYVPTGVGGMDLPNVQESNDSNQVFTVLFEGGSIQWPDMRYGNSDLDR